eukprot:89272-Amorphochlora_amoeboformis.AAC.3
MLTSDLGYKVEPMDLSYLQQSVRVVWGIAATEDKKQSMMTPADQTSMAGRVTILVCGRGGSGELG